MLLCVASLLITAPAFGQLSVVNQGGSITINDNSSASPYPSTNLVSGTVGLIEKLTITLTGVTHGYPDDIDALLEGPDGTKVLLMSDAGGKFSLQNTTFTLDSSAGIPLPDEGQIVSGSSYAPANYEGGDGDNFAAPSAGALSTLTAGSYSSLGTDLSTFIGKGFNSVNGTWNLFLMDDTVVDGGNVRSWSVNLYLSPVVTITNTATVALTEDTPATINVFVNDSDTPLSNLTLSATSSDTSIIPNSGLTFGGNSGGTNRTLTITPAANAFTTGPQTVTITVTAKDAQGIVFSGVNQQTFQVTVTPVDDPPVVVLGATSVTIPQAGISNPIALQLTDVDNPATDAVLTAISSNPSIIPATNVLFSRIASNPAGTNRSVQIAAGAATGTATISIVATDTGGASSTNNITVTVAGTPGVIGANTNAIVLPNGFVGGTPANYPSTITVPNIANSGRVGKVVVSLINVEHLNSSDIGVLLVPPSGPASILMRDVGGTANLQPVGVGDTNDVRLTFDRDAATALANGTQLTTSTNLPADAFGGVDFPAPAPAGPYNVSMDTFLGGQVSGDWKLYVYDIGFTNYATSQISGGWTLKIIPAPVVSAIANTSTPEDTSTSVAFSVSDYAGTVTNVVAQLVNPGDAGKLSLSTSLNGTNGSISIVPAANFNTGNGNTGIPIQVVAQNSYGFTGTNTFTFYVTPVNDPPVMGPIAKQITRAGQSVGPIAFSVSDVETPASSLILSATSNNPKLLPPGSIVFGGTDQNRTVSIFPAGSQGGTADVTVTLTDAGDGINPSATTSVTFNVRVQEAANPLYENLTGIQVLDPQAPATAAQANPYPSVINVSGLSGSIAEVQVTLFGITHPQPDDLDILLVGPGNTPVSLVLMSDAGGTTPLNNVTLRFRESASAPPTDNGPLGSGDYQPVNYEGTADFPAFGSPAATTATLDTFIGTNPNGDWKLYVVDDQQGPRGGVISSWQLSIRTKPSISPVADVVTAEDTPARFTVSLGDSQPGVPYTVTFNTATATGSTNVIQSITSADGQTMNSTGVLLTGSSQTFTVALVPDANGTNIITIAVTDPDGNASSRTFNLIVTPVNDPPRFGSVSDISTATATPTSLNFTVYDPEGGAVGVVATSSDQSIVTDSSIIVSPASGTTSSRTVSIIPVGVANGKTTITLTASDPDGGKTSKTFVLTVTPSVAFLNTNPIQITDNAPANPYPATIDVSGVTGTVSGASVVLVGFTHPFPDDVDILLVAPDGRSVMLMSDAGGGTSVSNLRLTFADSGATLPDETALQSGVYAPANYVQAGEIGEMPSPAPAAPNGGYSTSLASLAGVNPNGQWKLFVRDDTFPDGGVISGGWVLLLQTAPTITQLATQTTQEDTALPIRFTVSDQDTPASGLSIGVSIQGTGTGFNNPGLFPVLTGPPFNSPNLTLITNGSNFPDVSYTLTLLSATNRPTSLTTPETNKVTITATDGTTTTSTSFLVVVTPVNDAPQVAGVYFPTSSSSTTNHVVTTETTSSPAASSPITVKLNITDVDSRLGTSSNVVVQSLNATLLPNKTDNIAIAGANDQAPGTTFPITITLTPAANQSGTATVNVIVHDEASTVTNQFVLEVTPVNNLPTLAFPSLDNTLTTSVAVGGSITVPVTVNDVETPAQSLLLSATSSSQSILPNGNILVSGRGSDRRLTLTTVGTVASTTPVAVQVVVNDTTGGLTTNSFTVRVTPPPGQIFTTAGVIAIPGTGTTGPASPYPSTATVAGMIGNISKISVSIDGLTHTAPDDIDMLLVSPSGAKVMLMSDAGGRNPISNVQLVFDQSGGVLPDEGQITTGTYQPVDYEPGTDIFPSSAPAGPYTASLAGLIGTNPNGVWSLYIVDDAAGDVGQIATGWTLRIETAPSVATSGSLVGGTEDASQTLRFTINDQVTSPSDLAVSFSSTTSGLIQTINTNWFSTSGNQAVIDATIVPVTNAFGTNNLTIVVRRSDGAQSSVTVPMNLAPVNDPSTVSRLIDRTTTADTPITIPIAITDVDTPLTSLVVSATSGNTGVISTTNILVGGITNILKGLKANNSSVASFPSGNLDTWTNVLTVVPNAAAFSGSPVPITLSVQEVDSNGNAVGSATTVSFNVTVTPVNHNPFFTGLPTLVAVEAGKTTTNILFSVGDPDNDNPLVITASSSDQTLVKDSDISIDVPSGAPGARQIHVATQAGVTGDATINLRITDPNGGRNVGSFVVRLTATRERVFSNHAPITIRDNNSADPYPSQIAVSGFVGNVSRVTVTLNGFWHTFPDDVDMILVSPSGQKSYLMSDAGGGTPIPSASPINIKFDDTDASAVPVPDNTALSSRTYKVANYEGSTTDDFVNRTPAGPAGPYAEALSTFNGSSPNGNWSLYIVDDTPSDSGAITNGWSIGITTLPVITGLADVVTPEDVPARIPFTVADESFASQSSYTFAVSSSNPALVPSSTSNIVVSGTGANLTVTVIPAANANTNNAGGPAVITLTEQTSGVQAQFRVTVIPVNDPPVVGSVADQTLSAGTFITVPNFSYSDVETAKKDLVVTVASSDPTIIPTSNVVVSGTDIRIFAGTLTGTAKITLTVTDTGDGVNGPVSTKTTFNVTVATGFNAVVASTSPITIVDNSRANPYPSTVQVRGVNGSVNKVTVTLIGLTHPFPDDIDILLVGPNGQGVVLMSDVGAGGTPQTALNNAWLIIDDAAPTALPDNSAITPFASYKPTNFEVSDTEFLSPAPQGPYSATLTGAFGNINPNGTWSLYVQDDASPDAGSLSSWVLNIALNEVGPTITGLADTNVLENAFVQVPFTIGSATSNDVTFATSASNSNLVSSIKVGGSGSDRVLQITLLPNTFGSSQITVAATDATGTRTRQFLLTVAHVDQPPAFGAVSDLRINGTTNVVLNISDVDTPLTSLTLFASTAGVGLIQDVQFSVIGSNVVAQITPAPNQKGTDTLTISVSDGTTTVKQSFNVTVVPPGPPVLAPIADVTASANAPIVVRFGVSDPDTLTSDLTFFATSSGSALIRDVRFDLVSADTAEMTITPNVGASGTERITVSVTDGTFNTSTAFNLTVTPPAPVIAPIADQTTQEDVSLTIPISITSSATPLSSLTLFASTSDPSLVRDVTFITAGNTVSATIRLVTNAFGSATITVSASDGVSTVAQSFRLTVTEVCEPPVIGAIADQTATGSSITVTIPVTDPDDPIAKLNFSASTAGNSIVSGATFNTATDGTVTATFTLFANANGTEQVTVQAADGCSSGRQTFNLTVHGVAPTPTLSSARSGTNLVLTITGGVGSSYVVESTTTFAFWTVVDTITIGNSGSVQLTVPMTGKDQFFRVRSGVGALAKQKSALLVVGNTTLVAGDLAVSNRLVTLGYSVTVKSGPASVSADANGQTLVVVSSTISSGDVNTKFRDTTVPVVNWEQALEDDFQFTGNADTDHNTTTADQTQLNILATSHPLAAGLSAGLHTVASSPTTFSWGNPQGSVTKIATVAGNTNQVAVYGYEAGALMVGTNKAAGRRVMLFLQDAGISNLTAEGLALFDAAITWAVSSDVTQPGDPIQIVNGQDDGDGTINTGGLNPPAAEGVEHVIDNLGQKYLNFLDLNSGFVVTPSVGRTLVTGLRLWTANDSEPRDPASYKLEGSVNGPNGPFTLISQGALALPSGRNTGGNVPLTGSNYQEVYFPNTAAYTSYRLIFPTTKQVKPTDSNSMQIAEVEFFGFSN